jgi:hypothetical protein
VSINLLRGPSAASRGLMEILTYDRVCSGLKGRSSLHPGLLATIDGHLLTSGVPWHEVPGRTRNAPVVQPE